jgi:hypothetical protein
LPVVRRGQAPPARVVDLVSVESPARLAPTRERIE